MRKMDDVSFPKFLFKRVLSIYFTFFFLDYASLLLPKSLGLDDGKQPQVATGRFFFRKKSLTYSFVTSLDFGWPKLVTFLIREGSEEEIIEEFPVHINEFQVEI